MKYPFTYTIQGYNYNNEKYYLENGIGICEGFKDSADILEQRYDKELIAIKHLELYEEDTVITLPEDTFKEVIDRLESVENFSERCNEKGEKIFHA